ncbi:hypothetical protein [Actinophytocola sp.]|uniref:hypothetical protein n=1 Tax=Actinophytocola sp. TaxID=1872138 RepID=UPI003899D808
MSAAAAGTASADPTWTVTPGGAFHGTAGETLLEIQESGIQLSCASSSVDGTAQSGSGLSNPLATIPESPGIQFIDCSGPFGLTFEVTQVGDWALNGVSYDGSDVTTGTIDNINADIVGPGCNATASGSVNVTYSNSTSTLEVLPDFTLEVSFVDPDNNCLGLINQGEHANFSGSYAITPGLTVTSP